MKNKSEMNAMVIKAGMAISLGIIILLGYGGECNMFPKKDDSGSSTPSTAVSGIAVDPYIANARFFEDVNNNGQKDTGEQESTSSDINGRFIFGRPLTPTSTIVINPAFLGRHNGVSFIGRIKRRVGVITGTVVISPLTTLLANGWSESEVISALSTAGLTGLTTANLKEDPMEGIENLDSTTLTETHLTKIRASICVYSFMTVMDTLIAGKGYDITPISFTGTAGATQALANMVITVNTALSTGLLSTIQTMMSGAPSGTPKVTAGDVIRSAVAISNYIIPKVAAAPTVYAPNLTEINSLGQSLGVNFYNIRNKGNGFIQYAVSNSIIPGALPGIMTFNTLTVNSSGVVVGQQ